MEKIIDVNKRPNKDASIKLTTMVCISYVLLAISVCAIGYGYTKANLIAVVLGGVFFVAIIILLALADKSFNWDLDGKLYLKEDVLLYQYKLAMAGTSNPLVKYSVSKDDIKSISHTDKGVVILGDFTVSEPAKKDYRAKKLVIKNNFSNEELEELKTYSKGGN